MRRFMEKRLNIYPNEARQVFWLVLIFFIMFASTAVYRNYVDTAFLKRYGPEHIPLMLVINGGLTFVFFSLVGQLGRRFLDYHLMAGIMGFYALTSVGCYALVKGGIDLAYPSLFQLLNLLDSIQLVYLWNMAGDLFDARQGKRVFPLITASQVLSTSLGSYLTRPIAKFVGNDESLIFFAAACLALTWYIFQTGPKFFGRSRPRETKAKKPQEQRLIDVPRLMKNYPIIRFLIVLGLAPSLLLPIFNYQFNVIANNTFHSEQALMAFLGFFRGTMTLATFLALFIVGRLYSKMGLAASSLIYPLNFAALFAGLTLFFNIHVAAVGQLTIRLVQRAIHGPVNKILFSLVPEQLIAWSRNFVRATVVKVGMLAGALLMIALKPLIDAQFLAPIAAAVAFYWLFETILFGRRFHHSLKQVIVERRIDFDQIEALRALDSEGVTGTTGGTSVEDRQDLHLAEVVCRDIDPAVALHQLDDSHSQVRAEAAGSFACNQDIRAVKRLVDLLDDDEVVRKAAIDALMTYREAILPFLEACLLDASVRVQRSILEVIRLSGCQGFEMQPFIGRQMTQAYTNLIALRRLEKEDDSLASQMLLTHLAEKNDEIISLIFHALWVNYADMRLMYEALKSKEASVAVEMVEVSLDKTLSAHLIPLIEDIPLEEKIAQGRKTFSLIRENDLDRVLVLLSCDKDATTRLLSLLAMGERCAGGRYLPAVERLLSDPNPQVREVAEFARSRCLREEAAMPNVIDLITNLKAFSIFDGMGIRELQAIASIAVVESFAPDQELIREGEEAGTIYLIVKGQLEVVQGRGMDQEIKKATLGPGSFIGELSLFTKHPPNATCVAVSDLEAIVLRHHQFQEIMKIYPQIGINLCRFLAIKLRSVKY